MNISEIIREPFEREFGVKRKVVRPVPQTRKVWLNFGDLGQQEVNVLFIQEEDGIDVHSVSWKGLVITGDIKEMSDVTDQILEQIGGGV